MKNNLRLNSKPVYVENLENMFWAYFSNKMMMLLMMIEHPEIGRKVASVERIKGFLHDLYHHFLPQGAASKYHRAFKWLDLFLNRYPNAGEKRIYRGIQMVGLVYEAFGMKMNPRIEARRIERESFGLNQRKGGQPCSESYDGNV